MAKKKGKATKVAPKKGRGKKPAPKKAKPARAARPRQERLLDDMPLDRVMDRFCQTIADSREQMNELASTEKAARAGALARMVGKGHAIYKAHGVELIYVKGDDKLKVKLVDSDEGGTDPGDYVPGTEEGGAGDVLDEPKGDGSEDNQQ